MVQEEFDQQSPRRAHWRRVLGSMWFWWAAVMIALLCTQAFVLRMYAVPSASMEATLEAGDRILVQQVGGSPDAPERGDVVVFSGNPDWGAVDQTQLGFFETSARAVSSTLGLGPGYGGTMVKRTIGLPGESVSCCDDQGNVMIDGEPIDEPYIHQDFPFLPEQQDCSTEPASLRCFGEVELGQGEYFMLGDHRSNSMDASVGCRGSTSPCQATLVHQEDIVGEVQFRIWPLTRFGSVE